MAKKRFVIIDGNAIIHRGYHALPPMTAADGTMVNAVYGFSSMLLKAISELKPTHLAVSFDVSGKTFRDEIYSEYKAKRVKADQELYDQIPLVYEVVKTFDIPIYTKKGYEADDVIATVSEKIRKRNARTRSDVEMIVVTGDKDMLQLVEDGVKVYLLRRGMSQTELFDESQVKKEFGFASENIIDYKALKGDSSDNIPGIKGIGDKTAKELIIKIGDLDEVYKNIDKLEQKGIRSAVINKLKTGKKDAYMSRDLAELKKDLKIKFKLKDSKLKTFDPRVVADLFKKFEFFSLVNRIPGYGGAKKTLKKKISTSIKTAKIRVVKNKKDIKSLCDFVSKGETFACDLVLSGSDPITSDVVGVVLVSGSKSFYIEGLDLGLKDLFSKKELVFVGHDIKKALKVLMVNGVEVRNRLFDIMVASYLLNSSTRAHDLKRIVSRELGVSLPSKSDQASLFGEEPTTIARELELVLRVKEEHEKELVKMDDLGLFNDIEMALVPILSMMELNGVAIDTKVLSDLSDQVAGEIKKTTQRVWKEAGEEFNVASSVQLREVLFEKMKIPSKGIKKGKTGLSTAAPELEKLRGMHPIIELIEKHREFSKLQNTYVDVLPRLINKKTGRIHTTFNQAVTTTGRLSSSDPNLQNIPIRTDLGKEIRNAFVSETGNVLVAADYSQIELRIVASLAEDAHLLEIFNNDEDVHKATAAAINDVPLSEVTKKMRYAAKEVNFGVLYGMGSYGLSWRAGISRAQAKEFIDKYFKEFSGVKRYIDQTLEFAKKEGYVETLFGRRRYIPELKSGNFQLRSAGERMAINMPIQGTAADLMKVAMIKIDEKVLGKGEFADVKMTLQVHDELVFEVKKGKEEKLKKVVKEVMEEVAELRVPIKVEVYAGKRWGELK